MCRKLGGRGGGGGGLGFSGSFKCSTRVAIWVAGPEDSKFIGEGLRVLRIQDLGCRVHKPLVEPLVDPFQ